MPTEVAVTFDDMAVLSEGGIEVFILDMDEYPDLPPFYIDVAGRRFAYSSVTFPSNQAWIRMTKRRFKYIEHSDMAPCSAVRINHRHDLSLTRSGCS